MRCFDSDLEASWSGVSCRAPGNGDLKPGEGSSPPALGCRRGIGRLPGGDVVHAKFQRTGSAGQMKGVGARLDRSALNSEDGMRATDTVSSSPPICHYLGFICDSPIPTNLQGPEG